MWLRKNSSSFPSTERTNYIARRTITWEGKKYLCSGRCIKLLIFIVPHLPKEKPTRRHRQVMGQSFSAFLLNNLNLSLF
jgi:hypothetical protein